LGFFIDILLGGISAFLSRILIDIVAFAGTVIANEHKMAVSILDSTFIINLTHNLQIIAGLLLSIKLAVEVTRQYILFASGDGDVSPIKSIRRTIYAGAMIAGGPWLAREVFTWGAQLSIMIAQTPIAAHVNPFENIINALLVRSVVNFAVILVVLFALIFYYIVLVQTVIRAVELAFISVAAPIMAVGLTDQNEGIWGMWWREMIVLSMSQAVQMFFLTGFFSSLVAIAHLEAELHLSSLILPIAWLYVAFKSPAMLKQYAHHTGVGQMASGTFRTYISPMIRRIIPGGR